MFLTLIVVGLLGLVMMAIPAFGRHGHAPPTHGHGGAVGHGHVHLLAPAPRGGALAAPRGAAPAPATHGSELLPAEHDAPSGVARFLPSPRAVFTVLALYGAFGNALIEAAHLSFSMAALVAAIPALLIERLLVRPLWNLLFRFQGQPSSPLALLLFAEAEAVVPFRNGRGLVAVDRDGRRVQLSARLRADQAALPVKVGERLRIEDIDARRERVTVSVLRG